MATDGSDDSASSGKDKNEETPKVNSPLVEKTPQVNSSAVDNDSDSHYFIHPNDTTISGAVIPLLDTSNYHT